VRCRRASLDRQLANGRPAFDDAALSVRADQLCSSKSRSALADFLVGIVDMAYERPLPAEAPRLDRDAIVQARTAILDLAGRLRSDPVVNPMGVALARRLLDDKAGPLYVSELPRHALDLEVRAAIAGLDAAAA
jgi:hypothetical protein